MKARLLWVDLEMTGLDPTQDKIVEVGAIATDFELREIARFHRMVKIDAPAIRRWTHDKFWNSRPAERAEMIAQIHASGQSRHAVENELLEFLNQNFDLEKPIYLVGNSIHQDQKFIAGEWPRLAKKLHYRQLDVSAWKIIFENRGVKFIKPEAHRAMSDIEGSIAELKYYLTKVKF
jgi:oligoribonuclease